MQLIDTHVHLMMPDYKNLDEVVDRAKEAGVTRFVVPGINLETSRQAIELAKQYPEIIPAVGLHPMNEPEDLEEFKKLAALPEVKAIGEIGTDIRAEDPTLQKALWGKQEARFRFFLDLAVEHNKPALVHTIRTWDETIKVLAGYPQLKGKVVMHCFSLGQEEAAQAKELGLLISITAIIARKGNKKTHDVIKDWPLEQMMLETDGPWLQWPKFKDQDEVARVVSQKWSVPQSPEGDEGPNEPKTLYKIAELIAEIKGVSVEEVATQTTQTAQKFFGL